MIMRATLFVHKREPCAARLQVSMGGLSADRLGIISELPVNREEQGPEGCLLYRLSTIYGAWSSSIDAMAFSPQKTS
jgi:hypothetical protein